MKAKVAFGEDIRHWHYPAKNRYEHLVSFVEQTFKLNSENKNKRQEYYFQFEDAENDKVRICNEQDLLDAFECAQQENRQSLKIFVISGSINNDTTHQVPSQKKESDNDVKSNEKCHESQATTCNWQKARMEFLSDEKVRLLLPELAKRVINVLHENIKNGNDVSLAEIVPSILEEKIFEDIVHHEFFQNYLQPLLPLLLAHASPFTHVLLNLDEEAVGTWISEMINVVTSSFLNDDHEMWSNVNLPPWCHSPNNAGGEAIHYRVKCDGCGVAPIQGVRYKCGICLDYDLCEKCEASNKHDPQHVLLKIKQPIYRRKFGRHDFAGLKELIGTGRCGRWRRASGLESEFGFPFRGFGHCRNRNPCWMKFACENKEQDKDKLHHRKEKLMEKLAKINSKLDGNDDDNKEENISLQIKCACGGWLVQTTPETAYPSGQVSCDRCERNCTREKKIYHCPMERSWQHPHGYDVCLKCANDENNTMSSSKQEEPVVVEEKQVVVEEKPVVVEEKPIVIEKEKISDPFENFEYAAQAHQLVDMGFSNYEQIKNLLTRTKGNLEEVVAELFQ